MTVEVAISDSNNLENGSTIDDVILTSSEAAKFLNIHINTLRKWSNAGLIRCEREGKRRDRKYSMDYLLDFLGVNELTEDYYCLPTREVARLLDVHCNSVRRYDGKGKLKSRKINPRGDRRFSSSSVIQYMVENNYPAKSIPSNSNQFASGNVSDNYQK